MKIFNAQRVDNLPEGILFDTDNTLYDYTPAHEAASTLFVKKSWEICHPAWRIY